jgi:hypothetical protein
MRYFVLLSALLTTLSVSNAFAQEVSGRGHLQLASGDSLHGEIRANAESGEVWIHTADGADLEFPSTQLTRIEIGDRALIPTPKVKYASSSFEASPPALMNVVVEGPATLLSVSDNDGLFLATREGIAELRATDEKRYDELRAAEAAMHFHAVLHRHASDCLTIVERINFLPMDRDRIIDYVRRYNACIDPVKYQYRPSFGRKRLQFRLAGAIAWQSSEHFAAEGVLYRRIELASEPRTIFQGGFGVELQYPDDRRGRSFDVQLLYRSYSFTDERDEYLGGCRTDSQFGCPAPWEEGEYKYYLNLTHYHVADLEAMIRFLHPIVQRGITPKVGVGVLVQLPIRREIESSGTMTYRAFGPNPQYTYTPIEIGYRTGRTVLQTPVVSLVVVHGRFSLDLAAMRLMRGSPRYEKIAPAKAGYLMTRATVGFAL